MYTMRYSFEGRKIYKEEQLIKFFTYCLKACIGAVAIWRIVIDPMPALLNDETIFRKTREMITEPYSDEFIETYIGNDIFELYKQSTLYKEYYQYFNQYEEQNEAVFYLIHYQCINRNNLDDIYKQIHLLDIKERIAVLFITFSEHITNIIFGNGLFNFTSNIVFKGDDKSITYGEGIYDNYFKEHDINQPYKGGFISRFKFKNENVIVIHNELFLAEELSAFNLINEKCADYLQKENDNFNRIIDEYTNTNQQKM